MSAKTVLNVVESGFPAAETGHQKLARVLKTIAMKLAMEEWQLWQFRIEESHIELSAGFSDASDALDPDGREFMIQCGGALFHLKLALKRLGCLGPVELFPDLDNTQLVSRVHYSFSSNRDAEQILLPEEMTGRQKTSAIIGETPISEAILDTLRFTVTRERAWLEFSECKSSRKLLLALTHTGVRNSTVKNIREMRQPIPDAVIRMTGRSGGAEVVVNRSRIARWTKPLLKFTARPAGSKEGEIDASRLPANQVAALAVLKTKTDDKYGWLATGQAKARLQLQAHASGVPSYFFGHAFRSRRLREEMRTAIGHKGFIQTIVGLGSSSAHPNITMPAQQLGNKDSSLHRIANL